LGFDVQKDEINQNSLLQLKAYLKVAYAKLPAPTVAGIDDPNIVVNVQVNRFINATF
jgi:hypothetical protein